MQRVPMTPKGHRMLQEKLKFLKQVERPKVVAAIEEARGHGDLSENAEYDIAKERQLQISQQIKEIEHKLSVAQVIDPSKIESEKVVFGATVKLSDIDNEEHISYSIVGTDESDISCGLISIESPIARALIGKEEGDEVRVKTPKGERLFEVVEIKFE
ncbi:MAG TPA: transcription elongation factor GreA [bacterium]|nr:transcription elongation factor GreA [bacterium]